MCVHIARGVRERTRETSHFTSNGLRKSANIVLLNDASLRLEGDASRVVQPLDSLRPTFPMVTTANDAGHR